MPDSRSGTIPTATRVEEEFSDRPDFVPRETEFSPKVEESLQRVIADFSANLKATARFLGRNMDEVQTPHVTEARDQLLASKVTEVANFFIIFLLPIGLFLLGLVVTPVINQWGQPVGVHSGYVVTAVIGSGLVFGSLVMYLAKSQVRILFRSLKVLFSKEK